MQNINWGKVKGIIGKFGQCAKQTLTVHRQNVRVHLKMVVIPKFEIMKNIIILILLVYFKFTFGQPEAKLDNPNFFTRICIK